MSLRDHDSKTKIPKEIIQKDFQAKNTTIQMTNVDRAEFAELNNKPYYFSDDIVSFIYGHPLLTDTRKYQKEMKDKIHRVVKDQQFEMLKMEAKAASRYESLCRLRSALNVGVSDW